MGYNVYFDYSALVLLVIVFILFSHMRNLRSQKMNLVGMTICVTILATVLDLVTIQIDLVPGTVPYGTDVFLNSFYLLTVTAMPAFYYTFVRVLVKGSKPHRIRELMYGFIPYAAILVMLIVNVWFPILFYFNENGFYTHGKLFPILYAIVAVYIASGLILVLRNRKRMNSLQKFTIICYALATLCCIVIEHFSPRIMVTQFNEALGCMLIFYSIDNPSDYINRPMGILNQTAFIEGFNSKLATSKQFVLWGVRIEGVKNIAEVLGRNAERQILTQIATLLNGIGGNRDTYYLENHNFGIIFEGSKMELEQRMDAVLQAFREPFDIMDSPIRLSAPMCTISCPDGANNVDDAITLLEYALAESERSSDKKVIEADAEIVANGRRESYVVQALKTAIENHLFEMYYQPIYSVEDGRYTRAEALVRLKDEKLGFISPDEFIPIAEQKGMIVEIGAMIFREVCSMLADSKPWERGIERVDVNLSAVQCMNEGLADSLLNIMDAYGIPYKAINFEITETAAIVSEEILRGNMERLLDRGVNFSMDDYGCGYSNAVAVIEYPFSVVKLDKSMLWSAMEKPNAMSALKHTIAMLNEMGYEIITEGVETREMADKLVELGCSLHQGYLYSKAVPVKEFLNMI